MRKPETAACLIEAVTRLSWTSCISNRKSLGRVPSILFGSGLRGCSCSFSFQSIVLVPRLEGSHFPHVEEKTAVVTQIDPINRTVLRPP